MTKILQIQYLHSVTYLLQILYHHFQGIRKSLYITFKNEYFKCFCLLQLPIDFVWIANLPYLWLEPFRILFKASSVPVFFQISRRMFSELFTHLGFLS